MTVTLYKQPINYVVSKTNNSKKKIRMAFTTAASDAMTTTKLLHVKIVGFCKAKLKQSASLIIIFLYASQMNDMFESLE